MGYYEYVENAIIESGLDESVELLDILESAETVEDLEAIEEYLTEKEVTFIDCEVGSDGRAKERGRIKLDLDECDKNVEKAMSKIDSGEVFYGVSFLITVIILLRRITKHVQRMIQWMKNDGRGDAEEAESEVELIQKEIDILEKRAKNIAKQYKAGELKGIEAKIETRKIQAKIKALTKRAKKLVR